LDPLSPTDPVDHQDVQFSAAEGWKPDVIAQILEVLQKAMSSTPNAVVPFSPATEDYPKPSINTSRILHRAEQDLIASEKLVEERIRLAEQPNSADEIQRRILAADARLVAAIRRLIALGTSPNL
jgi:hypothetical protein